MTNYVKFPLLLALIIVFLGGFGIGLFYFGGLWLTVSKLPLAKHPYRFMFSSFFLRLVLSLGGFYLLVCQAMALPKYVVILTGMLGFFLARMIMINYCRFR